MEYVAKVIIVGDSKVGKTSLISRYVDNKFSLQPEVTVGIESSIVNVDLKDESRLKLQLWDTAGQERYRSLTFHYFKGTMAVLLVFDLSDVSTFENLEKWLRMIKAHSLKEAVIFLIGNKCDLERRAVSKERAEGFAREHMLEYFETSCKESKNVRTVIQFLATRVKETFYSKSLQRELSVYSFGDEGFTDKKVVKLDFFQQRSLELSKRNKCSC